ncbi:MAG: tetratricopeptide repeat protein [Candidatus Sumerlaeaceae bacterium]
MSKKGRKREGHKVHAPLRSKAPASAFAQSKRIRAWAVLLATLTAAALAALLLYKSEKLPYSPGESLSWVRATTGPAAGYIGSQSCAECHAEIVSTYSHVAMGRSLYRPTVTNIIEDYTSAPEFYHQPSQQYFRMLREGEKFFQVRYQKSPEGKAINELRAEINYIVGSGNHARSYLHEEPGGKLYQLPVAWYSQEKQWAMNPGYDSAMHMGFSRRITYDCMFCHGGIPNLPAGADRFNYGETSDFGTEPLTAIGCENCHGPAAEHVKLAREKASSEKVKKAIVNAGNISDEAELDTCMACHLETTSGKLPHSVQTIDSPVYSWRPGMSLADYRISFDHPKGVGRDDKFEIAGQAYRMRMSKCFTASQGRLTCTSCHDPHKVPENRTAAGIASCRECHAPGKSDCTEKPDMRAVVQDNCIQCHMPQRRTDDVVHVVMTDHFIQRFRRPEEELLAPRHEHNPAYKGEIRAYYPEQIAQELSDLYYGIAYVVDEVDVSKGVRLMTNYLTGKPGVFEAIYTRGIAHKMLGQWDEAEADLVKAIELMPKNPQAQMALGDLYELKRNYTKSIACYTKAIELRPDLGRAHNGLGAQYQLSGRQDDAIAEYRKAVTCDPFDEKAHLNLANIYLSRRDWKSAEAAERTALTINPSIADGWHGLAQSVAAQGRQQEGAWCAAEALRLQPEESGYFSAVALMVSGLEGPARESACNAVATKSPLAASVVRAAMHVARRSMDLATRELDAVRIEDTSNSALLAYAGQVALDLERYDSAQLLLSKAVSLKPDSDEAIVGLATASRATGNEMEADKMLAPMAQNSNSARALNALAWLRATAKTNNLRNGAEAERLVRQAIQLLGQPNLFVQQTLAAALAEQGKFDEAIAAATEAHRMARQMNRDRDAAELDKQLELYRTRKPYRSDK